MNLTVLKPDQIERWVQVTDVVLKEFNLNLNEIQKRSNIDHIAFCKLMLAVILTEEEAPAPYISKLLNIARTTIYPRLKVAGSLLETHPIFKEKYLQIIQIITANED